MWLRGGAPKNFLKIQVSAVKNKCTFFAESICLFEFLRVLEKAIFLFLG